MERIKVLVLSSNGAADLALSLKSVLEAAQSFDLKLRVKLLSEGQPAIRESILFRVITRANPQTLVLCLKQSEWSHASAIIATTRKNLVPIRRASRTSGRELLKLGPEDFLTPPFRLIEVVPRFWRLQLRPSEADPVVLQLKEKLGLKQLIGESPALLAEIQKIPLIARCDASVLISGETGTGKEMCRKSSGLRFDALIDK